MCVESSLSNWEDVLSGIPQGSVLGSTLIIVFINDMPDVITSLSKMFADDASVQTDRNQCRYSNTIADIDLVESDQERDLSIIVDNKL